MNTLLKIGALATAAVLFMPEVSFASCAEADLCSQAECIRRQQTVHPTCDVQRACQATMSVGELRARVLRNEMCLSARLAVSECFSAGDSGHAGAIREVGTTLNRCMALLPD